MLAPPLVGKENNVRDKRNIRLARIQPNRSSEKRGKGKGMGEGRGLSDGEKDRLFIQLLLSFHHQLSSLSPLFHSLLPLSNE